MGETQPECTGRGHTGSRDSGGDCGDSFQRDRDFTKRRRDFLATWYKAGFGQNQGKGKRMEKK